MGNELCINKYVNIKLTKAINFDKLKAGSIYLSLYNLKLKLINYLMINIFLNLNRLSPKWNKSSKKGVDV